jgi:transcriptional regulator with XRE-family HTH domain
MSNKENEFVEWLDMVEGGKLTDYELAKAGKFSHSVLSRARSGIPPKWDVCVKIAGVLNISPITVFRKAGLLPPGPDNDISLEDWEYLLRQLTKEERDELWQIGVFKIDRRQKDQSIKTLKPKKAG